MNAGGSGISGREAIVTLVACALLGLEVVPNLVLSFAILIGFDPYPQHPLYVYIYSILGLVVGCVLGAVLLKQGGVSVPSRAERGASRGALVGLVVGLVGAFLLGVPIAGSLGTCGLVGLAVGRTFDGASTHPTP